MRYEFSFDTYHDDGDRLYRIASYSGFGEKQWSWGTQDDPAPSMRATYADVEAATRRMRCGSDRVTMAGYLAGMVRFSIAACVLDRGMARR